MTIYMSAHVTEIDKKSLHCDQYKADFQALALLQGKKSQSEDINNIIQHLFKNKTSLFGP